MEVKKTAQRMGITTNIRAVDAISLGTSEVYPIEVVSAYGTFANKGVYSRPLGILRIEDRFGNIIFIILLLVKLVLHRVTVMPGLSVLQRILLLVFGLELTIIL